jgi:hypothetical protein
MEISGIPLTSLHIPMVVMFAFCFSHTFTGIVILFLHVERAAPLENQQASCSARTVTNSAVQLESL